MQTGRHWKPCFIQAFWYYQISQSEWLIFVGRKFSKGQNVVSFVENQLKLTESTTDKNLSENARCFFDQEAKFPPSRLI